MDTRIRIAAVCAVLGVCIVEPRAQVAPQATIEVTTTSQAGPGCTITDAILTARSGAPTGECTIVGSGPVVIHVPDPRAPGEVEPRPYVLTASYLEPPPQPDESATAFPIIRGSVTIQGDGAGTIITRDPAAPAFRLFRVQGQLELRHLTLAGGDAGTNCCGARHKGGAIFGDDLTGQVTVTVRNVTFENNTAGFGGAMSDFNYFAGLGVVFTIEDSTFRGNRADNGGAINVAPSGSVTVRRSLFADNVAAGPGGAIHAQSNQGARIDVADSTFLRNQSAGGAGGAISSFDVTLTRVTLRENTARNGGGALANSDGVATIVDSTFAANSARRGGGVHAMGRLVVTGSTFTANAATDQDGGAIFLDDRTGASRIVNSTLSANRAYVEGTAISVQSGGLTLVNDTITKNTTSGNWGPALRGYWNAPTLRVSNSIIADNTTNGYHLDIYVDQGRPDALFSLGSNLIGNATDGTNGVFVQPGDQVGTSDTPLNPGLLPLGDNGGPTFTHALAGGSRALDAGSLAAAGTDEACLASDQRGKARPAAGTAGAAPRCDIGAVELRLTFPLTLHVGAGGSVVGLSGETPCTGDCNGTFDDGAVVKLEARPSTGHSFVGWLGGGCEAASSICFVTMSGAQTVTATFHLESAGTTTVLTSSANPSVNGQDVTFTVVVASNVPATATPSGSVTFVNVTEGTVFGTAPLDAGTAKLTRTPRASTHVFNEIKAIYTGNGTFTPSSDTLLQVVNPANTAIALSSSAAPSVNGQPVTFTAVVSAVAPGTGTPAGTVRFKDSRSGLTLDTVTLDATGTATVSTSTLPAGLQLIEAFYTGPAGDPAPDFEPSTNAIIQTVNKAWTTTVLTSSSDLPLSDQVITFTAKVARVGPGAGTPTGAVSFVNTTTTETLGTALVGPFGNAVLKKALPAGTHTITATYDGDDTFTSSSGNLSQITLPLTVILEVNEVVIVADAVGLLPAQMLSISETVVVSDQVALLPAAMLNIAETVLVQDGPVLAPQTNTAPGNNVQVQAAAAPVTLTFTQILKSGFTSVSAAAGPPPPAGFKLTNPATIFEISTSATYSGVITVCIGYPAGSLVPRLMHFENGVWVDRTSSVNPSTRTVCGSVSSLSPFAVFEHEGVEGRMTGAGTLSGGHEFTFRVAEESLGDERGALTYTHETPKSGKQKAQTDRFRATSIGPIAFWDDPVYRASKKAKPAVDSVVFSGTGTWNGAAGYSFEVEASDEGEPGRGHDTFSITIRDPHGTVVATSDAVLAGGNIQSQRIHQR